MMTRTAIAPTRIDLAGGTLDIWPLNMLVERAITINVAIDLWANTLIEALPPGEAGSPAHAEVNSQDQNVVEAWPRAAAPPRDSRLPLIAECVRFFEPETSLRLTTRSEAPAGSGLGGSSSLAVSMLGALQAFLARTIMAPDRMVRVARDLEARVLGIPTGTQDHYAAVYGGAAAIRYGPGGPIREPLGLDLGRLGERLVLAFTGASRMSATANWDMMRRVIDGDREARAGLVSIAAIAQEMRGALLEGDLDAAAGLLDREWAQRRRLSPKVTTANIDGALAAARAAGAIGGKVCGAGGGGCVALLCREGTREPVVRALEAMASDGVRVLTARPTAVGLQLVG